MAVTTSGLLYDCDYDGQTQEIVTNIMSALRWKMEAATFQLKFLTVENGCLIQIKALVFGLN